ncbi:Fructose-2,6-bisphosphatase, partial [Tulasnella sp. 408]
MDLNTPSPDDSRSTKLDLKALDTALEKRTIELPAGVTPGGSINTIAVVPLGPSPTSQSVIVESPEQEVPHYASLDAVATALRSGSRPAHGSSLEVPDAHAGPFYGAKSAALKQFDESRAATRTHSVASTPPRSVADPVVIAANVALKASAGDPDYKGMSHEEAVEDFTKRIRQYEAVYETVEPFEWEGMPEEKDGKITPAALEEKRLALIDEAAKNPGPNNPKLPLVTKQMAKNVSYLKVINVGKQHGESQYNVDGRIGGDAPLSPRGEAYAQALPSLILDNIGDKPLKTARHLPYPKLTWKSLDELDAGVCDGMTYEEIEEHYPEDFANRDEDKFNYRYRGGESYRDVVVRLEPVIMELERQENVLVIGHQAIVRC